MVRVLLVDDCRTVREAVRARLEASDWHLRVYAVPGVASCLAVLRSGQPFRADVVLLDLRLTAGNKLGGLAILPLIQVPVVLFSAMGEVPEGAQAMCAGYLRKDAPIAEIAAMIHRVAGVRD